VGVERLTSGDAKGACEILRRAMERPNPEAVLALGKALLELNENEEALSHFDRILTEEKKLEPRFEAYVRLLAGIARARFGPPEACRSHLDLAARLDPRLARAAENVRQDLEKGLRAELRF
jgi:tetratricopeptide (TPR) repeat protein